MPSLRVIYAESDFALRASVPENRDEKRASTSPLLPFADHYRPPSPTPPGLISIQTRTYSQKGAVAASGLKGDLRLVLTGQNVSWANFEP